VNAIKQRIHHLFFGQELVSKLFFNENKAVFLNKYMNLMDLLLFFWFYAKT